MFRNLHWLQDLELRTLHEIFNPLAVWAHMRGLKMRLQGLQAFPAFHDRHDVFAQRYLFRVASRQVDRRAVKQASLFCENIRHQLVKLR